VKIQSILFGLALSSVALADGVSVDRYGKSAHITGSLSGTSSEIFDVIAKSHELGSDFFHMTSFNQGLRSFTSYKNKHVSVSLDSAFAVNYHVELKGKKGDLAVDVEFRTLSINGEPARILMAALMTAEGQLATLSGKVACEKVVAPRAVPTCTLTL